MRITESTKLCIYIPILSIYYITDRVC